MTTTQLNARPRRERSTEVTIPLKKQLDGKDGEIFVSLPVDVDLKLDLADWVIIVLLGNKPGSSPQLVMRPRDP